MPISVHPLLIAVFVAAALMLAWHVSHSLLVIFSGILIATVLDAAVRGLRRVLPLPRPILLTIVTIVIAVILALAFSLGGVSLWRSVLDLWDLLSTETAQLYGQLEEQGLVGGVDQTELETTVREMLPDPTGLFTQASSLFGSTLGIIGDFVVVLFLGLFFAINPGGYRDGFLLLMPRQHRARILDALGATGESLRGWMVTQLAVMVLIGTLVGTMLWVLNVPNALILGILAGALNFIPFLGPIISAVPVLLVLAAEDGHTLLIGAVGLLLIQNLEGYVLTPTLQQRVIKLSPAWSLSVMAVLGSLFGLMGVALATPIFAVVRTLVLKLYVEPREEHPVLLGTGRPQSITRSTSLPSGPIR
jgi:predicted PurR-regulated permease PerM